MRPLGGLMKLHGGVHENLTWGVMGASGPQEASWGIHGNLIGVSWGPHEGSWGHHDSSWGALWGLHGDLMRAS